MSFFVVPLVLYQTKKKLDDAKKDKDSPQLENASLRKKKRVKKHRDKYGGDLDSLNSQATDEMSIILRKKHSQSSHSQSTYSHSSGNSNRRLSTHSDSNPTTPTAPVPPKSLTHPKHDAINITKLDDSLKELKNSQNQDPGNQDNRPRLSTAGMQSILSNEQNTSISPILPPSKPQLMSSLTTSKSENPTLDKNRNNSELSTTSSSSSLNPQASKFRRNSSFSSMQSSTVNPLSQVSSAHHKGSTSSRFSRKLSSILLGGSPSPSPTIESKIVESKYPHPSSQNESKSSSKQSLFKASYDNSIPLHSSEIDVTPSLEIEPHRSINRRPSELGITRFVPLISLGYLNSIQTMKEVLFTPGFQIFRYNNFLSLLSDHNHGDPINFASIRHHSIQKFINKYRVSKDYSSDFDITVDHDSSYFEGLLAHKSLEARRFLRGLIKKELEASHTKIGISNNEELMQINFTNYVRYVLDLPSSIDSKYLNKTERKHYEYKTLFSKISTALYLKKKEEVGGESLGTTGETEASIKAGLLVQLITKVSYEYILLEKYHIQILSNFNNNSIIDGRVLAELYSKHRQRIKEGNPEQLKVLFYNVAFSAQYAWYLSVTIPFVRVFESNVYAENHKLIKDGKLYDDLEKKTVKNSFEKSDKELFDTFTKKLYINDFKQYKVTTPDKLVKLHKLLDNNSPKYAHVNRRQIPDPSAVYGHKPMNFEYYDDSLSTLADNTFDFIQSRDLPFQITLDNYLTTFRQLHRVLKPGGTIEVPFIHIGQDCVKQYIDEAINGTSKKEPQIQSWLYEKFDCIHDVTRVILQGLLEVFGKSQVKYSIVLLNNNNEVNHFLYKHVSLILHEMVGHMKECCMNFKDSDEISTVDAEDVHYLINIKAHKKPSD
ncbi:uncharacterized protein CANTADRAFT_26843 [Suhomyces tanzawaensis NRRL Y-17324]|uniref:Uncharacterized protein n=1 Tax=Suhomyces tanzawaensis NRRL Y-17324 TaxID=984487 RepID=A0A1E4SE51_9ASCO|nr:uncharacterized protein CANTADRAFT_26843 [Suhomyces tanzawaensis NRRL Y-17324]ODV77787.1 hypothetical protein CANTADRAFT_26843 [Suhomyces tanzawaensis NRRL Y-17324]